MRQGAAILIAILLAYSGLEDRAIGQYEMLLYVGYLLSFAWISGLIQALLAFYPRQDEKRQAQLFFQSWLVFLILSLSFGGLLLVFPQTTLQLLTQQTDIPYAALFAAFLMANLPATLQEHFYLLQGRAKAIVVYGAVSISAQLLVVVVPPLLAWSFSWSFWGLVLVGALKFMWLTFFVWRYGNRNGGGAVRKAWLLAGRPLVGYTLLGAINVSFAPWLVGFYYAGDEFLFAVYRYGARELPFVMALAGAFSSAMIPVFAIDRIQGLQDIKTKSRQLYHLLFPVSILLLLSSRWWFVWLFSERFEDSVLIFNVLLLLTANHLLFPRTILVGLQDTGRLVWFAMGSILVNVLASTALVPYFGLAGIAGGTVIAYFSEKVAMLFYLQRRHGISLSDYTDLRWWLAYTSLLLLSLLWQVLW